MHTDGRGNNRRQKCRAKESGKELQDNFFCRGHPVVL